MMRRLVVPVLLLVLGCGVQAADTVQPSVKTPAAAPTRRAASPTPAAGVAGAARDHVELDSTQITGNRELPRVMYVVPWKRLDIGELGGGPIKSLLDGILEPLDREVFKRQNRYFEALQPAAAPPPGGVGK